MKVKFGSIVTDGRGKIGGHVMSKNRAGSYLRTKVTPVNPNTVAQVVARNALGSLSIAWRGLTSAQRLLWNSAVESFSKTDIFGDIRNPTGQNLYIRLNANLLNAGRAAITVPPLPVAVGSVTTLTPTQASGGATSIAYAPTPVPADHSMIIEATAPVSPGKSFVKSEFRKIAVVAAAAATPFVATAAYATKFGGPGLAGQKVFFRAKLVNNLTGQVGLPTVASCIVS
jgi:hypothetical protein